MQEFRLKRRDMLCGMHQPIPEPRDIRLYSPLEMLEWLVGIQRLLAYWPWNQEASIGQERPGMFVVADKGVYEHCFILGIDRLFSDMVSMGCIRIEESSDAKSLMHESGPKAIQSMFGFTQGT